MLRLSEVILTVLDHSQAFAVLRCSNQKISLFKLASSWNARISSLRHDATVVTVVATCFPSAIHGIRDQEAGEVGKYKENRDLEAVDVHCRLPGLKVQN